MNVADHLAILQRVDTLRADLLALNRILRGTLAADSKRQIVVLIDAFHVATIPLALDAVTKHVIGRIRLHARSIRGFQSNDGGGYIAIEKDFNQVMNLLGFIKGKKKRENNKNV